MKRNLISYNLVAVLAVDLLATSGDVTLSWTSPIYPKLYLNDTNNPLGTAISKDEDAWLGSLLTIGAIVGPLPFSLISEKFGRKIGLLCIAVPHIISYIVMGLARNIYLFYLGRVLGGLAMGGGYVLIPMYIAEISQDASRGMMSQTLNIFWAIGNFLPYAIGPYLTIKWFNIILALIPTSFFVIFLLVAPETPYYLVGVNKIDKAEESLMLLRSLNKDGVQKELEYISAHVKNNCKGNISDVFHRKELRKAFIICIVLIIAQEMSGFCAITFYLQPIFESTGTRISSDISALTVGFAMLISSPFAPFLVDRIGRRILTIFSCLGMFLSLSLIASFFYIQDYTSIETDPIYWIPILSLILFIFSYNFGIGSIPWTLTSELFPSNVKPFCSSAVSSTCWITTFLVTKYFNDMNYFMSRAGTFYFFAGSCLIATIFSIYFVPETKGKSFKEIQEMLKYGGKNDIEAISKSSLGNKLSREQFVEKSSNY